MSSAAALLAYLRALPRDVVVQPMALATLAAVMGEDYPTAARDLWFWERSALAKQLRAIGFVGVLSRDGEQLFFVRTG